VLELAMQINSDVIRRDFPILKRKVNNKKLVYFDNAASSQKPIQVIEAMAEYYYNHHANVHRGAHTLSVEATMMYEQARNKVAGFLNAANSESVVFCRNTTEAFNLFAYSWARTYLRPGDEIIIDDAEHHANVVPWHLISKETGIVIKSISLKDDYRLDLQHYKSLLNDKTKLVSIAHMSNVLGTINPIAKIADLAHEFGALMIVDGAQAAPHIKVDVQALGADFYALSGHKMLAPTGVGAFWAKPELLRSMPPFLGGGEMIRKVSISESSYADIPMRFEAGTPNIAEAIGLGAAIDYLNNVGMENVLEHDQSLTNYALNKLEPLDGISLYGPVGSDRGGIISFNIDGVHPHDVATALDQEGIAIRAGHHCAQPLMKALAVQSTARASFYIYNTESEVDVFVEALIKTRDFFGA